LIRSTAGERVVSENCWSRKTVRPSFRLSWNQSRQVTGRRLGVGQDVLGVEDVEALVLHRAHVEVADGDDAELVEVVGEAVRLLVPAHRALERVHGEAAAPLVAVLDEDAQLHLTAGLGGEVVLDLGEVAGHQREQV
jgi:hypothetical protein